MKKLWLAALAVALVGCVQTDAKMLSSNTAVLSAQGGAASDQTDIQQSLMVEAAKKTVAQGFKYFVIMNSGDQTANSMAYMGSGVFLPVKMPAGSSTVRMYHAGEINPATPGVWNASDVLATARNN